MKKIIIILLLCIINIHSTVFANVYSSSVPVEGMSIASDELQLKLLKDIYQITLKLNPLCSNQKVVNTQIIHFPYDVKKKNNKYVEGYWKELWSIDYCGQKVQIPVTFIITKKETLYKIDKF